MRETKVMAGLNERHRRLKKQHNDKSGHLRLGTRGGGWSWRWRRRSISMRCTRTRRSPPCSCDGQHEGMGAVPDVPWKSPPLHSSAALVENEESPLCGSVQRETHVGGPQTWKQRRCLRQVPRSSRNRALQTEDQGPSEPLNASPSRPSPQLTGSSCCVASEDSSIRLMLRPVCLALTVAQAPRDGWSWKHLHLAICPLYTRDGTINARKRSVNQR